MTSALEQMVSDLAMIANWKDGLNRRMERGQLLLETEGLGPWHDQLIAEARAFCRFCHMLAAQMPGRLGKAASRAAAQREAA